MSLVGSVQFSTPTFTGSLDLQGFCPLKPVLGSDIGNVSTVVITGGYILQHGNVQPLLLQSFTFTQESLLQCLTHSTIQERLVDVRLNAREESQIGKCLTTLWQTPAATRILAWDFFPVIEFPNVPRYVRHTISMNAFFIFISILYFSFLLPAKQVRTCLIIPVSVFSFLWIATASNVSQYDPHGQLILIMAFMLYRFIIMQIGKELPENNFMLRKKNHKTLPRDYSITEKIRWQIELVTFPRGLGYNWEATHLLPCQTSKSRGEFLKKYFLMALSSFILADFCNSAILLHGWTPLHALPARLFNTALTAIHIASSINAYYTAFSFGLVLFNIYPPTAFPPIFGDPRECYSIRRFWAHTWHQQRRAIYTLAAEKILRSVGHKRDSAVGRATRRAIAFGSTGLTHALGAGVVSGTDLGWLSYFALQFVMVELEEGIVALYDTLRKGASARGERTRWERVIGYIWTVSWLLLADMWLFEAPYRAGRGSIQEFGTSYIVSLTKGLLNWREGTIEVGT